MATVRVTRAGVTVDDVMVAELSAALTWAWVPSIEREVVFWAPPETVVPLRVTARFPDVDARVALTVSPFVNAVTGLAYPSEEAVPTVAVMSAAWVNDCDETIPASGRVIDSVEVVVPFAPVRV
jgi:hypothetical protein